MENIKFIGAQNEIQKIYSDLGLIVPVGDLDNGKAPAIQPLPATSTTTSITAKFNVMSGADISSLSYKVNDGEATSITPAKGVVTITLSDLEYNSGPYEIELTATNETGSTSTSNTVDLQHYTNWATPDEVLLGNKYIGEDGQESVGTYVPEGSPTDGGAVITSAIYNEDGSGTYTEFTFESLPTGMDLDNHRYLNVVMSRGYNYISEESGFEEVIAPINQIGTINYTDTFNNQYNSSTSILHLGFCDPAFYNDATGEEDTEVTAVLYIYEDTLEYNSLKWVIPCTIINGIV